MSEFTVFAPGAWSGNEGKEVPVVDRTVDPPRQVGISKFLEEKDGVGVSIQLFDSSHAMIHRGELSINKFDVACRACGSCSCHHPHHLLRSCSWGSQTR